MIDPLTILGFIAGALCTISFLPQVVKIWRTKSAADISLGMFIVFCIGVALWLVYGLFLRSAPIISANAVTLALLAAIILMKIRYRAA